MAGTAEPAADDFEVSGLAIGSPQRSFAATIHDLLGADRAHGGPDRERRRGRMTTLDQPVRNVFWALVRTAPEKRDPAAVEMAQAEAEHALAILDAHLAQRRFVGGEAFTMGDIPVGASVYRWLAPDLQRVDRPHVRRWYDRLAECPGFRAHVMQPLS